MGGLAAYRSDQLSTWVRALPTARLVVDTAERKPDGFVISVLRSQHIDLSAVTSALGVADISMGWNGLAELTGPGLWAHVVVTDERLDVFVPGFHDVDASIYADQVDDAAFVRAAAIERAMATVRARCVDPLPTDTQQVITAGAYPQLWASGEMMLHRAVVSGVMVAFPKSFSVCRTHAGFWMVRTGGAMDENNTRWFGTQGTRHQALRKMVVARRRASLDASLGAAEQKLITVDDFADGGEHIEWSRVTSVVEKMRPDAGDVPYSYMKLEIDGRKSVKLRFIGTDPALARAFFAPIADRLTLDS